MAAIKHLFHIDAPRQKVYDAISTINGISGWWTTKTTGDDKVGGVMAFRFMGTAGMDFKVTGLKNGEGVNMECVAGFPDWIGTTLSFQLDENEGKTRVRFTHDNWAETGDNYAACCFSWGRYMESLRQLCQTGKGAPFANN